MQNIRGLYDAFASGDRDQVEKIFADEFRFSSPLDVGLDRQRYFGRCWPGAGQGLKFAFVYNLEVGEEVIVTCEAAQDRGRQGAQCRNFHLHR